MKNAEINICKKRTSFKSLLLIGFCSCNLLAYPKMNDMLYAQNKSFTIELSNVTVKNVFDYIENNSEFVFLYDQNVIRLDERVDIKLKDQPIQVVLEQLFKGKEVTYEINDRQISLKKVGTQETPIVQQSIKVEGLVKDNLGPVAGANILEKGTNNGVITDADGKFSINVSPIGELRNILANQIKVNIMKSQTLGGAAITRVLNLYTGEENVASRSDMVAIEGSKLKSVGPNGENKGGEVSIINSLDAKIVIEKIADNTPSRITFMIPNDITEGEYRVQIETYFAGSALLKEARVITSSFTIYIS